MIGAATMAEPEADQDPYILRARMRKVKEDKEVRVGTNRYVVCFNPAQAGKDARDREAIVESLREQLKRGAKSFAGNKGYRKHLNISK